MTAVQLDLKIEQGTDWPGVAFTMTDADGAPYPVSGCTAKAQIRKYPGDTTVLFTWSSSPGAGEGLITLVDDQVILSVTAAQSSAWSFDKGRYDVELTNPAAPPGRQVTRVAAGTVYVDKEVTL